MVFNLLIISLSQGALIVCRKRLRIQDRRTTIKNLLMPLFLMGCFPMDFQEVKRPLRTKSAKRPIKVGKRPINEGKRPIKAKVLVGVSVGCLMGCFRAPPPWRKTAPLKRPIISKQGSTPTPWSRGLPENGRSRPRKPFISRVFCAQRGSETMV